MDGGGYDHLSGEWVISKGGYKKDTEAAYGAPSGTRL